MTYVIYDFLEVNSFILTLDDLKIINKLKKTIEWIEK